MNKFIYSLILIGLPLIAAGQNYRDGYVVKQNGDSLMGSLLYKDASPKVCKFKANGSRNSVAYGPQDLRAFGSWDGRRYVSLGDRFARVIVSGTISLLESGSTLFLARDNKITELTAGKSANFKEVLDNEIKECGLSSLYTRYDRSDIANLIKNYHRCKRLPFDEYKERVPVLAQYNIRAFAAYEITNVSSDNERFSLPASSTISGGLDATIDLPKRLKNFAIIGGLSYSDKFFQGYSNYVTTGRRFYDDYLIKMSMIRIPVGVQLRLAPKPNTAYINAGFSKTFTLKNELRLVRDIEIAGIVTGSESKTKLTHADPLTFWAGAGYSFSLSGIKGFVEARYNLGRMGESKVLDTRFSMAATSLMLGVRF